MVAAGDRDSVRATHEFAIEKKTEFAIANRMRFNFNVVIVGEFQNARQPRAGLEGLQVKKELRHSVAHSKPLVLPAAVEPVEVTLFPWPKREISSDDGALRKQLLLHHVCAEMRMVVPIYPIRRSAVEPLILLQLRLDDVVKR